MGTSFQTSTNGNQEFQVACAYLFSPEHAKDPGFLRTLNVTMLKKAFREKAKRYHPDLHGNENDEMVSRRKERFVKIQRSYEYLCPRVQVNAPTKTPKETLHDGHPKIIAIGGAKGGIGKSLFASNLSVFLSKKGLKTVAADFDLGGANLHLYLGTTRLEKHINDFLDNKSCALPDIIQETKYGPQLIGGNSSRLGAANIGFARKIKLMKALRNIKADFVVVDLGGDTSFNVLDFFLAADHGIVMTTCDPASYMEAYTFIKLALYRKLNRIFGAESGFAGKADPVLKKIIQEATYTGNGQMVSNMDQLKERIRKECPQGIPVFNQVLSGFNPYIVVNKSMDETASMAPVQRIQLVSKKTLSIEVNYLCTLPYSPEIEKSARTLVPFTANSRDSEFTQKLEDIYSILMA